MKCSYFLDLRIRPPTIRHATSHPEGGQVEQDLRVALADEVLLRPQAAGNGI